VNNLKNMEDMEKRFTDKNGTISRETFFGHVFSRWKRQKDMKVTSTF